MTHYKTELLAQDAAGIERAAELLRSGQLVAFPTETVYGLAADATSATAVNKIYVAKGRPIGHPLIVHAADADAALSLSSQVSPVAEALAAKFWPGPLTLILPRGDGVVDVVTGGRPSVGLRVPAHPVAARLCAAFGGGIAAPSANRFGGVSPTTAKHVLDDLGGTIAAVLDGGPCDVGLESTIVEVAADRVAILRPGAITEEMLRAQIAGTGVELLEGLPGAPRAPGMLLSHYSPQRPMRVLEASEVDAVLKENKLRYAVIAPFCSRASPSWQLPSDAAGYGRQIYAALREADGHPSDVEQILVVPPVGGERLAAIIDRLQKAAHPGG